MKKHLFELQRYNCGEATIICGQTQGKEKRHEHCCKVRVKRKGRGKANMEIPRAILARERYRGTGNGYQGKNSSSEKERRKVVKKDLHPRYQRCEVICGCKEQRGVLFVTRSTQPQIKVEICSLCHPFFTGKQKIVDSAGRVERFKKRYDKFKSIQDQTVAEQPAEKTEPNSEQE